MENNIFISYAHEDKEIVAAIVAIMKEATNMNIWYDNQLRGGENFFSAIANEINECQYFAFMVSKYSIKSEWCLRELEYAASERKIIVPIWLEDIAIIPRVKLTIQNTQYIHYYSLTEESFSNSLTFAFSQDAGNNVSVDRENDLPQNETYFLKKEEIKKIEKLLSNEKKHEYSICFQEENAHLLGLAYELGIKTNRDLKKAQFYYKISDYKGNYDGKYLYAALTLKLLQDDPDHLLEDLTDTKIEELQKVMIDAAEHNSVYALTYLGDEYYYGRNGFEQDKQKAYDYWKIAANLGKPTAMYFLSYGYRWGECVEKNYALAIMYALMALEFEFPRAYRILGFMYENGEMLEKSNDKAIEMFEEAIKHGDYLSLCYEGYIYGENGNLAKKKELYEKAYHLAEEGKIKSPLPYYRMGYIYEYGEGVEKDLIKAIEFYFISASRKHANSLKYTVDTIMKIKDTELRESYLHKAYELECKDSAYELGNIEKAKRKSQDDRLSILAIEYYTKGAENENIYCVLELIYEYSLVLGHGKTHDDRNDAIKWFQFFFAHMDKEFLEDLGKEMLSTFYYAYAIELDYDPDVNMPDREFVKYYFEKSLESDPKHLNQITSFIVNGYLFPEKSDSGLDLDILHAQEMLELIEIYLPKYLILNENEKNLKELFNDLESGYTKISECYRTGNTVVKNKELAKKYRAKAKTYKQN